MVNIIYLFSFVETPRKFIIVIINLRGVSTKLNKYSFTVISFTKIANESNLTRAKPKSTIISWKLRASNLITEGISLKK